MSLVTDSKQTELYARTPEYPLVQWNEISDRSKRKNPGGAGNVQGSPTDLAWLAGYIDGDGWIGIFKRKRSPTQDYYRYSGSLSIGTTSDRLHERTCEIFDWLGMAYNIRHEKAYVGKDGSPRRAKWWTSTGTNVSTATVLNAVRPYLVEKRRCADLVLRYIEWRESSPASRQEWSEKAEQTIALLRADRNRHDPSTTTRSAPTDRQRVRT